MTAQPESKLFRHYTQPYGFVEFQATLHAEPVRRYGFYGAKDYAVPGLVARGPVTGGSWVGALLCGVPVVKPRLPQPLGTEYEVEVTRDEWERGSRISVAG
jgi:hypothetical protein